jgi:5-methyltetrahydropteroyltriglutamate--homocysteine methyltransferase
MQRSDGRILTTHTGSLPRPEALTSLLLSSGYGDPAFPSVASAAVRQVVRRQLDCGVDVLNDGEQAKPGFATYVTQRLTGFASESRPRSENIERTLFPEYYRDRDAAVPVANVVTCTGPIAWAGDAQVERDIANLKSAVSGAETEVFMTAASPGVVWYYHPNAYYGSHEAYIYAAAEALQHEYNAIHRAGFLLQVDCPDLAGGWNRLEFAGKTVDDFRRLAQLHVEALNYATRAIPPDRMRLHVCWGNFEGPHVRDIPLAVMLDILLSARPAALSFEAANPRHAHEWTLFEERPLPDDKILIPGVLDSTTNFVEHPELVAERLVRFARIVGRERLIAGTDCGFATLARARLPVHPAVTWAKLSAMAEGARIASAELWR